MGRAFGWSQEKNRRLFRERGISFEAVVSVIVEEKILAMIDGKGKYSHQKQFIVELNGYAYIVPFVQKGDEIFLKTIIPSRKMTRLFLREAGHEEI